MESYVNEIASGTSCPRNDRGERVLSGRREGNFKH